ncbi:MAG: DNA-3-methyladenine glycosylase [Nitrosopumilaceae archaeon]
MKILPRSFYGRDTVKVAKDLLGKTLVRKIDGYTLAGIITETEAYRYKDDPASHANRGITERNKAMFGEVGKAYVYFTYGMYYCFNVVAKSQRVDAGAILIRALEPQIGIPKMIRNRKTTHLSNLTSGPGKLTQSLKITKAQYGEDLAKHSTLYITEGVLPSKVVLGPRIGIRTATDKLWNFKINV